MEELYQFISRSSQFIYLDHDICIDKLNIKSRELKYGIYKFDKYFTKIIHRFS